MLVKTVEIYENQRITTASSLNQWSVQLHSPCAFSTKDGTTGWPDLEVATKELLGIAWSWESTWTLKAIGATDEEGWEYADNFRSMDNRSSANKGAMHFVRRRRWCRRMIFRADLLCDADSLTCQHCDQELVREMSSRLLGAASTASMQKFPQSLGVSRAIALTNDLIQALHFRAPQVGLEGVYQYLQDFAKENFKKGWSVSSVFTSSERSQEKFAARCAEVASFFNLEERNELAKLIIRYHDSSYEFHCADPICNDDCAFAPYECPREGCKACVSRKWARRHEDECLYRRSGPCFVGAMGNRKSTFAEGHDSDMGQTRRVSSILFSSGSATARSAQIDNEEEDDWGCEILDDEHDSDDVGALQLVSGQGNANEFIRPSYST